MPSVKSPIIITSCNDAYVDLAVALIDSIRVHQALDHIPIGLVSLGLSKENAARFKTLGVVLCEGQWGFDFPFKQKWEQETPHFKALNSKLLLRDLFPSHDAYLWIDADAWIQTADAVTDFFDALEYEAAVFVLEQDRSYVKYLHGESVWRFHRNCYRENYGEVIGDKMAGRPVINAGVFALRHDAPHWDRWLHYLKLLFKNHQEGPNPEAMLEQSALNVAVYCDEILSMFISALYNWSLIERSPSWCPKRKLYVEPNPPFSTVRILHMTGVTKTEQQKIKILDSGSSFFKTTLDRPTALASGKVITEKLQHKSKT